MVLEILLFFGSMMFLFHLYNAVRWFVSHKPAAAIDDEKPKGFSILIPCYNEEDIICGEIDRLQMINYSKYEVIFIDDGSTDTTFDKFNSKLCLKELVQQPRLAADSYRLFCSERFPNYRVMKKANTGKGDSLNQAIALSSYPYIISLDADSYLAPDAIKTINACFADGDVIAAGGTICILQGSRTEKRSFWQSILINLQMLDYMKGFYIYKLSLSQQNALAIISGAFGVFQKKYVIEAGGFRTSLGEDIDMTLKLQIIAAREKNGLHTFRKHYAIHNALKK